MRTSRIAIAVAAAVGAAAVLTDIAPSGTTGTRATSAQNYYGQTNKGRPAQIDVHGQSFATDSVIEGENVIAPLIPRDIEFKGNRLSYHRGSASGNEEEWLELRREQGGRVITGWIRYANHFPGYHVHDSGKVSFTARLWASSEGVEWTGRTSDGKPLTMTVGYQWRSHDIALHPFTVTNVSRLLTCRDGHGGTSTVQVALPELSGVIYGGYFAGGFRRPGTTVGFKGAAPARGSVTTPEGVSVRATASVGKLAPQGRGLVATGTLTLEGTGAGYTCQPATTTFTLRPR